MREDYENKRMTIIKRPNLNLLNSVKIKQKTINRHNVKRHKMKKIRGNQDKKTGKIKTKEELVI